jgi:hypothetical protein
MNVEPLPALRIRPNRLLRAFHLHLGPKSRRPAQGCRSNRGPEGQNPPRAPWQRPQRFLSHDLEAQSEAFAPSDLEKEATANFVRFVESALTQAERKIGPGAGRSLRAVSD